MSGIKNTTGRWWSAPIPDEPYEFVPADYPVMTAVEAIIWGEDLQEGMVVVLAESHLTSTAGRADPDTPSAGSQAGRLRTNQTARWCRITDLRRDDDGTVRFVGEYIDGTLAPRRHGATVPWIVKLPTE